MKTLLILYFLTAISTFAAGLNFSRMEDGDRVEITLHSTGCFHNTISYYEVRKSGADSFFTEYAITWDKSVPKKVVEKKAVGELKLTKSDIDGLDALLGFYRGKREGSSTTQVSLLFEYYEKGTQIGVESLLDGSGGFGLEERKDLTSFRKLTERFQK
jgi:hypothetical protein